MDKIQKILTVAHTHTTYSGKFNWEIVDRSTIKIVVLKWKTPLSCHAQKTYNKKNRTQTICCIIVHLWAYQ